MDSQGGSEADFRQSLSASRLRASGSNASVTSRRSSQRTRRSARGGAHSPRQQERQFRELSTDPPVTHLPGGQLCCIDAVPGTLVVGGSFGIAVYCTTTAPPYRMIALHPVGDVVHVSVDPFAPLHRYVAGILEDNTVVLVSAKAGYTFSHEHALHVKASSVNAYCWTMALHAHADALPAAPRPQGAEAPPERRPLDSATPRVFVSLDADGVLAIFDPNQRSSYKVATVASPSFSMTPSPTSDQVSATQAQFEAEPDSILSDVESSDSDDDRNGCGGGGSGDDSSVWTSLSIVGYRDYDEAVGVNIVLSGSTGLERTDDGSFTAHGAVIALLQCRRSRFGHRLAIAGSGSEELTVPKMIAASSGTDGTGAAQGGVASTYAFSSGATVASRDSPGRMWVIDGAAGKLAAGVSARMGGADRAAGAPTVRAHTPADPQGVAAAPTSSSVSLRMSRGWLETPPFLRSGALRRHLVVEQLVNPPRLQLGVVHAPSDDPSVWSIESNPWDSFPLHSNMRLESTIVSGIAPAAEEKTAVPSVPVVFALTTDGTVNVLHLPQANAITPLLEAVLRERYAGVTPQPVPSTHQVPALVNRAPRKPKTFGDAVGGDVKSAAEWVSQAAQRASDAMHSALEYTSPSRLAGVRTPPTSRQVPFPSRNSSHADLSEVESNASPPNGVETTPKSKRRQRAVLVYATDSQVRFDSSSSTFPDSAPDSRRSLLQQELSEMYEAKEDLNELHAVRTRDELASVLHAESEARTAIVDEERRGWVSGIIGTHVVAVDEGLGASSKPASSRAFGEQLQRHRAAAGAYLQPVARAMQHGEGFTRAFENHVAALHPVKPTGAQWGVVRGQTVLVPNDELKTLLVRETKLFDIAELRLKLEVERAALQESALQRVEVHEDWQLRNGNWESCKQQFSLAADGTQVEMTSLIRDSTAAAPGSRRVCQDLQLRESEIDEIGEWHCNAWQYARRWPANKTEAEDDEFWVQATAVALHGADQQGQQSSCRVRRRVWYCVDIDMAVCKKLKAAREAHKKRLDALVRSLGLEAADGTL